MEKIDKFGLLWVKIFTTLFILGFFSYGIFYVLTFWKAMRLFCNDNIYDMWLQYVWWNFGGSTIRYLLSFVFL